MDVHSDEQLKAKCEAAKNAVQNFVKSHLGNIECDEILIHEIDSLQVLLKEANNARIELKKREENKTEVIKIKV